MLSLFEKGIIMTLKEYFSYYSEAKLEGEAVYALLDESSILEAECFLRDEGYDGMNVYFEILANIFYLENDQDKNSEEIAYLYYLLAYYIGIFAHPNNSEVIAWHYLDKAALLTKKDDLKKDCQITRKMICEEDILDV